MKKHNIPGYYLGCTLVVVFWLPEVMKFCHCTKIGFWLSDSPIPEGYEELF